MSDAQQQAGRHPRYREPVVERKVGTVSLLLAFTGVVLLGLCILTVVRRQDVLAGGLAVLGLGAMVLAALTPRLTGPMEMGLSGFKLELVKLSEVGRLAGYSDEEIVAALREVADEYTYARIMFGPTAQRPRAREIADLFELAGWKYRFSDSALETTVRGYPYREGIEVIGLNMRLVAIIADALSRAGMRSIQQNVKPNMIDPENPKYAHVIREVEVHVGHSRPE